MKLGMRQIAAKKIQATKNHYSTVSAVLSEQICSKIIFDPGSGYDKT